MVYLFIMDVELHEIKNRDYCGPRIRVKTFFGTPAKFEQPSKGSQLLDYVRCNASYFCSAISIVNTGILQYSLYILVYLCIALLCHAFLTVLSCTYRKILFRLFFLSLNRHSIKVLRYERTLHGAAGILSLHSPFIMPTLRSSVIGYRAAFTRAIRSAERFLTDEIVADSLQDGRALMEKVKAQFSKVEEAFTKLCDTEPSDSEELYKELDMELTRFLDIQTKVIARIKEIEDSIAEATVNTSLNHSNHSSDGAPLSTGYCREPVVETSLKPFTLTRDHTPQEFRIWLVHFGQYFASGYIHRKPLSFQRAFFDRCIDANLQSDLADYILPSTDVMGLNGCVKILENRFNNLYPIFNRRWQYFRAGRKSGEDSDAFLTRLVALYKDSDIDGLTKHENLLFVFLAGNRDDEIRRIVSLRGSTSLEVLRDIVNQ